MFGVLYWFSSLNFPHNGLIKGLTIKEHAVVGPPEDLICLFVLFFFITDDIFILILVSSATDDMKV